MSIILNKIDPHFNSLSQRSEQIIAQFDTLKNGSEMPDWRELKRLTEDVAEIGDQMEAMLPIQFQKSSPSPH